MGLNESNEQARGQILMTIPLPSLNKAYSMLIERESQRCMPPSNKPCSQPKMTALASNQNWCYYYKQTEEIFLTLQL